MNEMPIEKLMREYEEFLKNPQNADILCNGQFKCPGWKLYASEYLNQCKPIIQNWKYCPWCGGKIKHNKEN